MLEEDPIFGELVSYLGSLDHGDYQLDFKSGFQLDLIL